MQTPKRGKRKLTSARVRQLRRWFARREAVRRKYGTVANLATRIGVPVFEVSLCLAQLRATKPHGWRERESRLSQQDRRTVRLWNQARTADLLRLGTVVKLAAMLGVSRRCVYAWARKDSPRGDRRSEAKATAQIAERNALLRAWRKAATPCEAGQLVLGCCLGNGPRDSGLRDRLRCGGIGAACVWFAIARVGQQGLWVWDMGRAPTTRFVSYQAISALMTEEEICARITSGRALDGQAGLIVLPEHAPSVPW